VKVQGILFQYDFIPSTVSFTCIYLNPIIGTNKQAMETTVFKTPTHQLINVLKASLPRISTSWWTSLVIEKLIFQQESFARQYSPDSLEQLNLAALLRVVDQNWYELSILKELQSQ